MDIDILLALQALREGAGKVLAGPLHVITEVGGSLYLALLGAILYWCVDKRAGLYLAANFTLSQALNQLLKATACAYRPWVRDARVMPPESVKLGAGGYSFPSGHTSCAVAMFGGLAALYRKKSYVWIPATLMMLLIMFSRLYFGVHTPQDVLGSLVLGVLLLLIVQPLLDWGARHEGLQLLLGTILSLGIVAFVALKPYPMEYDASGALIVDPRQMIGGAYYASGSLLGLSAGLYAERKWVRFAVDGSILQRLLRLAAGLASAYLLKQYVDPAMAALLGARWGGYLLSAFTVFWIVGLYPLIGQAIGLFSRTRKA